MRCATLQWVEKIPPIEITSRTDLEGRLRDLGQQSETHPLLATLELPGGSSGYIGLGRREGVLFLHGPRGTDGWTQEWIAVGQPDRQGFTEFFLLGEHHSEFEDRSLLPIDDAIRAIGEFFESASPPKWLRWEENTF